MSMKKTAIGLAVGLWVCVYAALQSVIAGALGVGDLELWPVLMAPGLVGLLGGGKEGLGKYYKMMLTGILAACAFVLAEHALVPLIGQAGVLVPLALIVAVIVILGMALPDWFGGATFVAFNAATILTTDILPLTLARILLLFIGATVFLFVEQWLVKMITRPKAGDVPAENA